MARRITLDEFVRRAPVPVPWSEGDKIPWDEPAFSVRMLDEHLSQAHALASRELAVVERQVDWMAAAAELKEGAAVLDLGCGPGLYTSALARRGFSCTGIDFSPASIAHARQVATDHGLACRYEEADVRTAEFGTGFALVSMIYGEFNVFRAREAQSILERSRGALAPGGRVIVEAHTFEAVERIGRGGRVEGDSSRSWTSAEQGLFSDRPHLRLYEAFWDVARGAATERYFVIDAATVEVTAYAQSIQAYAAGEFDELFEAAGLRVVARFASLSGGGEAGGGEAGGGDFVVLIAEAAD